jgi:hypothetical protein
MSGQKKSRFFKCHALSTNPVFQSQIFISLFSRFVATVLKSMNFFIGYFA